ncbi:hypothetical protein JET18_06885 [Chryseobacterium sp. L7]|uniref:YARHG domain-containing protein n=1 Tax=Chryseobacterium endalhagicum TaxID=2797638 RepID=A0ABS1QE29_9FLAO|nr:hypothetical protein [Chryseobacterium endalhagicum]MBL1220557.1 hypothetical protein [Chryseobacterium endalhagicum]
MKTKYTTLLLTFLSIIVLSQNSNNKEFDREIFEYLSKTVEKDSTILETFILNSKPFSKWDIRPLEVKKVKALDSIYTSSQIPNFIWGAFSSQYMIPEEEAMQKPNVFLNDGFKYKSKWETHLKKNIEKFNTLSSSILQSSHKIFLNQITLQRVDAVYKENNTYWSYVLDQTSPYPISPDIYIDKKAKFSNQDIKILDLLKELNIYCAVKTYKGIFYLADGFTDNSYGIYFSPKNEMEQENHLFEIMKSDQAAQNYFYYIAN